MPKVAIYPDLPTLDPVNDTSPNWAVRENWVSQLVKGVAVLIRSGTLTDGTSIPRAFWRVIGHPFVKDILPHALGHDGLYMSELVTRKQADDWFLDSMLLAGVPWWKRNAIWTAVRIGGWKTWNAHTADSVIAARRQVKLIDCDKWKSIAAATGRQTPVKRPEEVPQASPV